MHTSLNLVIFVVENHLCRFKSECCHSYSTIGHIAKACLQKPQNKKPPAAKSNKPVHIIAETAENSADSEYQLFVVQTPSNNPLKTTLLAEGQQLTMEINTSAAVSLVSEEESRFGILLQVKLDFRFVESAQFIAKH